MGHKNAKKAFFFSFWDSCSFEINYKFAIGFEFNLVLQTYIRLVQWTLQEIVCNPSQLYEIEEYLISNTGSISELGVHGIKVLLELSSEKLSLPLQNKRTQ